MAFWKWQTASTFWHFTHVIFIQDKIAGKSGGFSGYIKSRLKWSWMRKRRLHCEASPGGEVWRVITSAFITSCMVDCILYCSGTGRAIHLHWLSYSRRLYGSGKEYQHEMSGWFGWPFTFLRIAAVIVLSLLPCPLLSSGILKIPQVKFFPTERKIVVLRKKLGNKELCWKDNLHTFLLE